jgi:hypothetical protein
VLELRCNAPVCLKILCLYLDNDPLSWRSRVHERPKQRPELLDDLGGDVEKKGQRSPGDPFRLRCERIDRDVCLANEIRMSSRFY